MEAVEDWPEPFVRGDAFGLGLVVTPPDKTDGWSLVSHLTSGGR
jgi:hypothetical protein